MNKPPEQLHLNVQLDDSISLDKFIDCDSTEDFLKILKNSTSDQSISNFYLIWGDKEEESPMLCKDFIGNI